MPDDQGNFPEGNLQPLQILQPEVNGMVESDGVGKNKPRGGPKRMRSADWMQGKGLQGRLELNQRIPSLGHPFLFGFFPPLPRVHTLLECREGALARDERGWG